MTTKPKPPETPGLSEAKDCAPGWGGCQDKRAGVARGRGEALN